MSPENGPLARTRAWRQLLGLSVAFAIAAWGPVSVWLRRSPLPDNDITRTESEYANLRAQMEADARVGWLVPESVPSGLGRTILIAAYAFLPIRFERLSAVDCLARGSRACGLDELDYVFVVHLPGASVLEEGVRLGLLESGTEHGIHLRSRVK